MINLSHAVWRKSSRSGSSDENCVEVAGLPGVVAVRDSKNPDGGELLFPPDAFARALAAVKSGRHDL